MKKLLLWIIGLVTLLSACNSDASDDPSTEIKEVHRTANNSETTNSTVVYIIRDSDIVNVEELFHNAIQLDGIVNMVNPQHRIQLKEKQYHLWFNEDATATLMDTEDTHTLYKISDATKLKEIIHDNRFLTSEQPPALTILIGEQTVQTVPGLRSWNYIDKKTGKLIGIEAESLPPTEVVSLDVAKRIDLNMPIRLNFEKAPDSYVIRTWGSDHHVISTYNDFREMKEKGKVVCEIVATWQQGTATYAFALDIQ